MEFIKGEKLVYEYTVYDEESQKNIKHKAIDSMNIKIPKGQFVAVLGHNGSGKSTLAKHINALLMPTGGTLWIKGLDTSKEENIWQVRQNAGMVFQNPDNQLIATIVEEDVAFGPENMGIEPEKIRKRVDEAIDSVRMNEYKDSPPHQLSGGQKQRIAIAGILAMKPQCIVLDEPTAMLDPVGRREVIDTVFRLNRQEGITIILITHYMEEAVKADRVIVVEKGKIVMDDIPKKIFREVEKLRRLKLDVPQVTELAYMLKNRGVNISDEILTIEEMGDALLEIGFNENENLKIEDKSCEISDENIIEVRHLTHIYAEETVFEKTALNDVSFSIKKGEFIGLIGHTGSGKSTLIQHLNALAKPSDGDVLLNGENIFADKSKLKTVRQKVGLVFQYPEHQIFETTIYKDVAFGPQNMGLDAKEVDKRVKKALDAVGLGKEYYNKSPFELSGGQKRRVAIAGILAMKPQVLVLDEPTAGLDPYGRDEILNNIKRMHDELKLTVILVSHSMEDISKLADRILVMHKGRLKYFDKPRQIFSRSASLEEIGLSAPQISRLMNYLIDKGIDLDKDIYTVEAAADYILNRLKL